MKRHIHLCLLSGLLALFCLLGAGCSQSTQSIAAKSILTAQTAYDATMSAAAESYRQGFLSEEGKRQVLGLGQIAHDSIALAQLAFVTYVDSSTPENELTLATALASLREHIVELIDRAVALGVTLDNTLQNYKEGQ